MKPAYKTKEELIFELEALRQRVFELEEHDRNSGRVLGNFGQGMKQSFPHAVHMDEAIFVIFERKLEFVNDKFADLFHISPEEACSFDFDPITLIAPESQQFFWKQYQDGLHSAYKTTQFNFTGLSKDGIKIKCETFLVFIPYKWGTAVQGTLHRVSPWIAFKSSSSFVMNESISLRPFFTQLRQNL